jgi:hypothetical protein
LEDTNVSNGAPCETRTANLLVESITLAVALLLAPGLGLAGDAISVCPTGTPVDAQDWYDGNSAGCQGAPQALYASAAGSSGIQLGFDLDTDDYQVGTYHLRLPDNDGAEDGLCGGSWHIYHDDSVFDDAAGNPVRVPTVPGGTNNVGVTACTHSTLSSPFEDCVSGDCDAKWLCQLYDDDGADDVEIYTQGPLTGPAGPKKNNLAEMFVGFTKESSFSNDHTLLLVKEMYYMRWDSNGDCVEDTGTNHGVSDSVLWVHGSVDDSDLDGLDDDEDNCVYTANYDGVTTPAWFAHSCDQATQLDGDGDGYGNICDGDVDQSGAADVNDLIEIDDCQETQCTTPADNDLNCDGAGGLSDLTWVNQLQKWVAVPGPSGLACADPTEEDACP